MAEILIRLIFGAPVMGAPPPPPPPASPVYCPECPPRPPIDEDSDTDE